MPRLLPDRIALAAERIDPALVGTPLVSHPALDAALGCAHLAKDETATPIRSFKGRGTDWFVQALPDTATPLVAASAGNFGQGLARACTRRGVPLVMFASVHANPDKVARMRALGADVRLAGEDFDAAKDAARAYAADTGARFVEDGREVEIAEGAGSIARELTEARVLLDHLLVPLGNGALLAGIATWMRHAARGTRVWGVVAAGAPAMRDSLAAGQLVRTDRAETIADGIAVREPVPEALEDLRGIVDGVLAVTDDQLRAAMALIEETAGVVVEPSGAAGTAAILADPARWRGQRVGTVWCGGWR